MYIRVSIIKLHHYLTLRVVRAPSTTRIFNFCLTI